MTIAKCGFLERIILSIKEGGKGIMGKKNNDNDYRRNGSGYYDPTAWQAIRNIDEHERLQKLLGAIHRVCELAGFHIEGRITLVDERTGRVWR